MNPATGGKTGTSSPTLGDLQQGCGQGERRQRAPRSLETRCPVVYAQAHTRVEERAQRDRCSLPP